MRSLKILCILFLVSFASSGMAIALAVLLGAPLVRWVGSRRSLFFSERARASAIGLVRSRYDRDHNCSFLV